MNDIILNYIRNMKKTGYTIQQIRAQLLKKYPPSFVDTYIHRALVTQRPKPILRPKSVARPRSISRPKPPFPEKDGPHTLFDHPNESIPLGEKIIGILIRPLSIFKKLKNEDMIKAFYFYFAIYFVMSILMAGTLFFYLSRLSGLISLPTGLLAYYFVVILVQGMFFPFALAAYYYLFLKVIFRMQSTYDQAYKALMYTMSQFVILFLAILAISSIALWKSSLFYIFVGLAIILWIYNTFTLIIALSDLCSVRIYKASIVVLLPIIISLIIFAYVFASYSSYISTFL